MVSLGQSPARKVLSVDMLERHRLVPPIPRSVGGRSRTALSVRRRREQSSSFKHHRPPMSTNETDSSTSTPAPIQPASIKEITKAYIAKEWKLVALRECPIPQTLHHCDTPEKAGEYWLHHIATNPYFDPERECFAVLMLNTRRRIRGHQLVSIGTMDSVLIHPRDVFRLAIVANAAAVILMHNHPSGDASPSDADIRVTRDLIRAGQLLKIEILDHVVMGNPSHSSLRAMGYFA